MRKITFIDPGDRLYEFSTSDRSILINAFEYHLCIRKGDLHIRLAMHVHSVRWEETFDYYHTIAPLRYQLSSEEQTLLEKLGNFSPLAEYSVLQPSYRDLRRCDPDELKKKTETIRI